MDRDYVLFVAQGLVEGDNPDNKRFGELLLKIIPADEKQIPIAVIKGIKIEVERGIERGSEELQGESASSWTQEQALGWIAGTPYVDDPRPGWTKRDLAMFARGYATGRSVQKINDDSTLRSLMLILERIERSIEAI